MSSEADRIQRFLDAEVFAVVGASRNRHKYGAKVLACYLQNGRRAIPVHPREESLQGQAVAPSLLELPEPVSSVSIITPPEVTEQVVEEAASAGVRSLWMQPGAESPAAVERAEELGLEVIWGGACLLVVLGYRE